MPPSPLIDDRALRADAQFEAQLARAAFESGHYDAVVRRLVAHAPENVLAMLWSVRALVELERYDAAVDMAERAAANGRPGVAGSLHAMAALARLYRGDDIGKVDLAIDGALAEGAAMANVVRASIHVAYGQLDGAERELTDAGETVVTLDAYEQQIHHLVALTVAACRRDEDALLHARERMNAFLARSAGLHYLTWSAFAVMRAHFVLGDFEDAEVVLARYGEVFELSASRRFVRQLEMIRDLVRHRAEDWRFTQPGVDQTHYRPSRMAAPGSGHRPLDVALRRRPVLSHLYVAFLEAGPAGLSKEDVVRRLWNVPYNPVRHDARMYKALGRLRAVLDECFAGTLVGVGPRWVLVRSDERKDP